jgi:glycosyltransferase involved in cell wall biosynthesis
MAHIVLADDGIEFDGDSAKSRPLGGVESSVIDLTRTLAARGHRVLVRNRCRAARTIDGVEWRPIAAPGPGTCDLFIANRGDKLLTLMPGARRTVFWIHNPARYLMKWRYLSKLWRLKPAIVFIGSYHATTYPAWAPGGERVVIPYGIPDMFLEDGPRTAAPPPRAVFTSNPLRGLAWLLDRWAAGIRPNAPGAELHVFAGPATYGSVGDAKAGEMRAVLARAEALGELGVVVRGPVPKSQLREEFKNARVMLYRGDENETFCLAVGEAQASGVPAVVGPNGSVVERVIDGETGTIADNDDGFAAAAVAILTDEALWRRRHHAALAKQRAWGWNEAAAAFEGLIPE